MNFGRYKRHDWAQGYSSCRTRLKAWLNGPGCAALVAYEAQYLLKQHYRGPWRMIAAMTLREMASAWNHYGWAKWNWFRVKVLRRPQDETIAAYESICAEEEALNEMAEQL